MSNPETIKKRRERLTLYQKQRGKCYWCQKQMVIENNGSIKYQKRKSNHLDSATIEHIRSLGITVAACLNCNQLRANFDLIPDYLKFTPKDKNYWVFKVKKPNFSTWYKLAMGLVSLPIFSGLR